MNEIFENTLNEEHDKPLKLTELQSQRQQLRQASQWADHAQRERINLCGELERKNRLRQESYATSCKEIKDLKGSCCEEENEVEWIFYAAWSGISNGVLYFGIKS